MNVESISSYGKDEIGQSENFWKKEILLREIKWRNIILLSISAFQMIFFVGFTFISFLILILICYIIFKQWQVLHFESRRSKFLVIANTISDKDDIDYTKNSLTKVQIVLLITISLCIIDLILTFVTMGRIIWTWLNGYDTWMKKFAHMTLFLLIGRLMAIWDLYYLNKKLIRTN